MRYSAGLLLLSILLVITMITAGCAKMPQESSGVSYSEGSISDVSTPAPTEAIVTFSTPVPTPIPESRPTFSVPPPDKNPEDNYSVVYDDTVTFNYNTIPFDYILNNPPMIFYYTATVPTVTDTKAGTSDFGSKDDYSVDIVIPNPLANYKITVYDKETNNLLYTHDIPKFSKESVKGSFKVYESGNYHVEITGNLATVNTIIMVPPENIELKE